MRLHRALAFSSIAVCFVSCVSTHALNRTGVATGALDGLYAPVQLPAGFRQVLAQDHGLIFTDDKGMSLYLWSRKRGPFCKDELDPITESVSPKMRMLQPYVRTCAALHPPVLAKSDAKPVGDWTIVDRPEGSHQWTYKGLPVHYSSKDRLPGDVNGSNGGANGAGAPTSAAFLVAQPPLLLPPGIKVRARAGAGLVAMDASNLMLYTGVQEQESSSPLKKASFRPDSGNAVESLEKRWQPLPASALAGSLGVWSARIQGDGVKVWTYQGQPVYRFAGDHNDVDVGGYGIDHARPLVLLAVSKAPVGVSVRRSLIGPVYTDAKGMTLYNFSCAVQNPAGNDSLSGESIACDNWDDPAAYGESYCPAQDRCAENWRPFEAPANAKVRGGTWSMVVIPDPVRYPLRWVPLDHQAAKAPGAVRVWTYQGRPLYTATTDHAAGDLHGHNIWIPQSSRWAAVLAGPKE